MKIRPVFSKIASPIFCPKCAYKFDGWHYRYIGIGDPNIVCPKCGTNLKLNNVEEWESEPTLGKILFGFAYIFTALRYTIVAFGLVLLSEWIFNFGVFFNQNQINLLLLIFLGIVTILAIIIKSFSLNKSIKQSKKRTNN